MINRIDLADFVLYSLILTTVGVLHKIIVLNFYTILIGRILHGLGAGALSFVFGKAMNETIP